DNRQGKFPPPQKGYKGRFGGNAGPRPEHDLRKRGPAGGGGGAGPLFPPAARPSSPPHARPSEVPPRAVPRHLVPCERLKPPDTAERRARTPQNRTPASPRRTPFLPSSRHDNPRKNGLARLGEQ